MTIAVPGVGGRGGNPLVTGGEGGIPLVAGGVGGGGGGRRGTRLWLSSLLPLSELLSLVLSPSLLAIQLAVDGKSNGGGGLKSGKEAVFSDTSTASQRKAGGGYREMHCLQ